MNVKTEMYSEMIERGLRAMRNPHSAIVICEQEEADARNEDDHMQASAFLDGEYVDLCLKANTKEGYVEVFDIKENRTKMLFGDVKILRWDMIAQKTDLGEPK